MTHPTATDWGAGNELEKRRAEIRFLAWFNSLSEKTKWAIFCSTQAFKADDCTFESEENPWLVMLQEAENRFVPNWASENGGHLDYIIISQDK